MLWYGLLFWCFPTRWSAVSSVKLMLIKLNEAAVLGLYRAVVWLHVVTGMSPLQARSICQPWGSHCCSQWHSNFSKCMWFASPGGFARCTTNCFTQSLLDCYFASFFFFFFHASSKHNLNLACCYFWKGSRLCLIMLMWGWSFKYVPDLYGCHWRDNVWSQLDSVLLIKVAVPSPCSPSSPDCSDIK